MPSDEHLEARLKGADEHEVGEEAATGTEDVDVDMLDIGTGHVDARPSVRHGVC